MANKKILLGLTTTPKSNWQEKIKEIEGLKISEISLFLTGLNKEGREKLYQLLKRSMIKSIPHIHLRTDMEVWELDFFVNNYQTHIFNIHPSEVHPLIYDYSKYSNKIYIENANQIPTDDELKRFAGLCIDFSHWENGVLTKDAEYYNFESKIKKYKVGCCHISVIKKTLVPDDDPNDPREAGYDSHWLEELKELYYIKKYLKYLSFFISIELENSFKEQLIARDYLEKIINNK